MHIKKKEEKIMALDGFGNRLKAVRQDRGYTQKQLADLLGVQKLIMFYLLN